MTPLHVARGVVLGAMLAAGAGAPAGAAMPSACSVLSLADVRAIVGAPVTVFHDQAPVMAKDGLEATNCLYMNSLAGGLSASVWLGRGPAAHVNAAHQAYATMKERHGANGISGNTLVVVSVATASRTGLTYQDATSAKLLAAVLKKL
jgi:hypothetical protein